MRLRWLRQALRELDEEAAFTALDDERAAALVVRRVFDAVAKLRESPALGHPGRVPGTRELVMLKTPYIVPYRIQGNEVHLLRVFHSSRRRPQRW